MELHQKIVVLKTAGILAALGKQHKKVRRDTIKLLDNDGRTTENGEQLLQNIKKKIHEMGELQVHIKEAD